MTIQSKSIKGSVGGLRYQSNDKGQALELSRYGLIGDEPRDWNRQMNFFEAEHSRILNKRMSFVISLSKEANDEIKAKCGGDEEMLRQEYAAITEDFFHRLQKKQAEQNAKWEQKGKKTLAPIDIENQSYISHLHRSTDDWHIHTTISRCNHASTVTSDAFTGKMAQMAAREMCKARGWRTAQEVKESKIPAMKQVFEKSRATNWGELKLEFRQSGHELRLFQHSNNREIYGARIVHESDINRISDKDVSLKEGMKLSETGYKIADIQRIFSVNLAKQEADRKAAAAKGAAPKVETVPRTAMEHPVQLAVESDFIKAVRRSVEDKEKKTAPADDKSAETEQAVSRDARYTDASLPAEERLRAMPGGLSKEIAEDTIADILKDYVPKGQLEGFPLAVVEKMCLYRYVQIDSVDITPFEIERIVDKNGGGFVWDETPEGGDFWFDVIEKRKFDVFEQTYPNEKVEIVPRPAHTPADLPAEEQQATLPPSSETTEKAEEKGRVWTPRECSELARLARRVGEIRQDDTYEKIRKKILDGEIRDDNAPALLLELGNIWNEYIIEDFDYQLDTFVKGSKDNSRENYAHRMDIRNNLLLFNDDFTEVYIMDYTAVEDFDLTFKNIDPNDRNLAKMKARSLTKYFGELSEDYKLDAKEKLEELREERKRGQGQGQGMGMGY